jgi:hypothetical protein
MHTQATGYRDTYVLLATYIHVFLKDQREGIIEDE